MDDWRRRLLWPVIPKASLQVQRGRRICSDAPWLRNGERVIARTILVLAPHTDDAELGCGGTIAKAIEAGDRVVVVAFSNAEQSLPVGSEANRLEIEMRNALTLLGVAKEDVRIEHFPVRKFGEHRQAILEAMLRYRAELSPDIVFTTASQDVHQDHSVIHHESLRAFRRSSVWCYELPWNQLSIDTTGFVILERRHIDAKCAALACYTSQIELDRPYFRKEMTYGLATVRGVQSFADFAEAFQIIRVLG